MFREDTLPWLFLLLPGSIYLYDRMGVFGKKVGIVWKKVMGDGGKDSDARIGDG